MAKISIITPTRNRPDFLKRCIKSVQNQTFKDYEHIIISDNCDHAEKVYNQFSNDDKIKLIKNNEVLTHAGSRKIGLEYSDGEYVTYLDDDDIILPHHLEKLYNEIIIDSECDIVWSKMITLTYMNIINGLSNLDYILKRDIYDENGDGDKIKISKGHLQSFLNSLQKRDLIDRFGGWKNARNSDGVIIREMLRDKRNNNSTNWNELMKSNDLDTKELLGFKFRKIEDYTCIYNSYGGSSNLSRRAKNDYLERLKYLDNNLTYCYDEEKKDWSHQYTLPMDPIMHANEYNIKRIIELHMQNDYVLMKKREDGSMYFVRKNILVKTRKR